jgi:hypothetical protein
MVDSKGSEWLIQRKSDGFEYKPLGTDKEIKFNIDIEWIETKAYPVKCRQEN